MDAANNQIDILFTASLVNPSAWLPKNRRFASSINPLEIYFVEKSVDPDNCVLFIFLVL